MSGHTYTPYTQDNYSNPRCACAPRVNYLYYSHFVAKNSNHNEFCDCTDSLMFHEHISLIIAQSHSFFLNVSLIRLLGGQHLC